MQSPVFERVSEAADVLRARLGGVPELAVVLGSGLGDFADELAEAETFPYETIPHWPRRRSSVTPASSSWARVREGSSRRCPAAAHYYEGHSLEAVTFAVRVMGRLGVKRVILTNAAGGVNTSFEQGALMVIDDHINLLGSEPADRPERRAARRRASPT